MLLNPTQLRRVYDNESLVEQDKDALTLPELMETVTGAIYSELDKMPQGPYTARKPMISSTRRNLQRELIDRLIDLAQPGGSTSAAAKPISNLALSQLRQLKEKIGRALKAEGAGLDSYTRAHLEDAQVRITKALDAPYIFNARDLRPRYSPGLVFQTPSARGCGEPGCNCQSLSWNTRR
jgi:hypothetical protein